MAEADNKANNMSEFMNIAQESEQRKATRDASVENNSNLIAGTGGQTMDQDSNDNQKPIIKIESLEKPPVGNSVANYATSKGSKLQSSYRLAVSPAKVGNNHTTNYQSEDESELNSNVGLDMLPNHGYTSGFTDGIHSNTNTFKRSKNVNKV